MFWLYLDLYIFLLLFNVLYGYKIVEDKMGELDFMVWMKKVEMYIFII